MTKKEIVARTICKYYGSDPDELEPGDIPRTDGVCPNGDPGHFRWRDFRVLARKILYELGKVK